VPVASGTPFSITFSHFGVTTTVNGTAGPGGAISVTVPTGYERSSFTLVDGGNVSPNHKIGYGFFSGWNIDDPIVPNGTDIWSSQTGVMQADWPSGDDTFTTQNFAVSDMQMNVAYDSGTLGIFNVSLTSGYVNFADGTTIQMTPGPLGSINTAQMTFALDLTGQASGTTSFTWSMQIDGNVVPSGNDICPYELSGTGSGGLLDPVDTPEPTSLYILVFGAIGLLAGRRRAA
jgi:hypothetical protein